MIEEQSNNQTNIPAENNAVVNNSNTNLADKENQDVILSICNDLIKNNDELVCYGNNGRWSRTEHLRFLGGCIQYGNNWKKVETYVKTRTSTQIRSHAQKYLYKLQKKYATHKPFIETSHKEINDGTSINNTNENNEDLIDVEENKNANGLIETINNNEKSIALIKSEEKTSDKKYRLSDEKIKQLLEDLTKPNFNIEIVEKMILKIFCFHKKYEDIIRISPDNLTVNKKNNQKLLTSQSNIKSNNKNIFLCQKLKREPNYEQQIRNMLNSNDQKDLEKLFNIFHYGKDEHLYKILMNQLNDNE